MDQAGGRNSPYSVIASGGGSRDWLGGPDHLVEGANGDGNLAVLIGGGSCPRLRTDNIFIATNPRLHDAAPAITIGLLPDHAPLLSNFPNMALANSIGLDVRVDDRRGTRRDDDTG